MKPIIKVENLSKQYRIGVREAAYATLRDTLSGAVRAPFKRLRGNGRSADEIVWALKDISFEVEPGEVVGIIGRNGAGKSTLLKILSRITEPTTGRVALYGRVGSLLEVGTGFHPELTGRENVYLNGAILGMSRGEVGRKFDEIVGFAEIEQFLDTPVKHYSSGMYMRLAFAVAAHLEPEILIVDEVLAVGDAAFQKKCIGKMGGVAEEGRTVLFVSHNMQAVGNLCTRAILLDSGQVNAIGTPGEVIRQYLSEHRRTREAADQQCTQSFYITRAICFGNVPGEDVLPLGELNIEIDVAPRSATRDVSIHILIFGEDGNCLLGFDSVDFGAIVDSATNHPVRFTLKLPRCPLPPGLYYVDMYAKSYSNQVFEPAQRAIEFEVSETPVYGNRLYDQRWHGQTITTASMAVSELHG